MAVAGACLAGAGPASAGDELFVDPHSRGGQCSDLHSAADAALPATPVCGLGRALAIAPAGSTVYLRAGAYPKLVAARRRPAETVTVRPFESEAVSLAGLDLRAAENLSFQGLSFNAGAMVGPDAEGVTLAGNVFDGAGVVIQEGSSGIRIERNEITNPTGSGVRLSAAPDETPISDVRISDNHFDGIGTTGVNARVFEDVVIERNEFEDIRSHDGVVHPNVIRTYGGGTGLVVRSNFIHDNQAICFFIKDGRVSNVLFENNLVVRNNSYGFQVYDVDGVTLANNTIMHNLGGVIFRATATDVVVKNNILGSLNYPRATTDVEYEDYNYVAQGSPGGTGPNDIDDGVTFEDPSELDYALTAGADAIDAGTSDGTPFRDLRKRARNDAPGSPNRGGGAMPFYDLGALEFGTGTSAPGPVTPPGPVSHPGPVTPTVPPRFATPPLAARVEYALPVKPRGRQKTFRWLAMATAGRRARMRHVRRGLLVAVDCSSACALRVSATVKAGRSAVASRTKKVRVARGRQKVVRVRFARRAQRKVARLLARHRKARLVVRVAGVDATGSRRRATRTLRLR